MSQNYTDDLYSQATVADTCFSNMENNFAALKSSFYGDIAPSNRLNGMVWYDSDNDILKIWDGAWKNVFDFASGQVYDAKTLSDISVIAGTGLDGGGILTATRTINHTAHTGDVTGAAALSIPVGSIQNSKLQYIAGAYLLHDNDGTSAMNIGQSWVKAKEIIISRSGTLRTSFILYHGWGTGGIPVYGRVYRNGSPVGTQRSMTGADGGSGHVTGPWVEDIAGWEANDLCQVYSYGYDSNHKAAIIDFQLFSDAVFTQTTLA